MNKNINLLTSSEAVEAAIVECDKLGRDNFLAKYGYKRARKYSLVFKGRKYDSKAIAGVAFGKQHGEPLTPYDFSGGAERVVPALQKLGFEILDTGGTDDPTPTQSGRSATDGGNAPDSVRFFWVNVGQSYDEVVQNKFLWAPQFSEHPIDSTNLAKGTRTRYHDYWTNVSDVKAGDIIFGNVDRKIMFVAVASGDVIAALRPSTRAFSQWGNMGFSVPINIFPLAAPLAVDGEVKEAFDHRYNELSKPRIFKRNGDVFQGYMAAIPDAAGVEILQLVGDVEADAIEASDGLRSPGQRKQQKHRKPVGTTTKQAIRDARVGQGYFRQELLKMWKGCALTGVKNPNLLLASHSKPCAVV